MADPNLDLLKSRVFVSNKNVQNPSSLTAPDVFGSWGSDESFSLESFKKSLSIDVIDLKEDEITFDLIGVEAPIANALRRILLSEIPTMAIERVLLFQNTSIIQDEVLCHRLGLIPIHADARQFEYSHQSKPVPNTPNELNTKRTRKSNNRIRTQTHPPPLPPPYLSNTNHPSSARSSTTSSSNSTLVSSTSNSLSVSSSLLQTSHRPSFDNTPSPTSPSSRSLSPAPTRPPVLSSETIAVTSQLLISRCCHLLFRRLYTLYPFQFVCFLRQASLPSTSFPSSQPPLLWPTSFKIHKRHSVPRK